MNGCTTTVGIHSRFQFCASCSLVCPDRKEDYQGEPIAYINEFLAALHNERVLADSRAAVSRGPWEAPFKP